MKKVKVPELFRLTVFITNKWDLKNKTTLLGIRNGILWVEGGEPNKKGLNIIFLIALTNEKPVSHQNQDFSANFEGNVSPNAATIMHILTCTLFHQLKWLECS